ncbi:MAG: ATP-binding protein [Firmicutes bacterium]|nr:ATP-binding protein [Bacillota bacterium]
MAEKLKFIIPGRPEYMTMVRLAIGSVADVAGFNYEDMEDIKTAVGEACKMITCHGYTGWAEEYTLECVVEDGCLEIYVTDTSTHHNMEKTGRMCADCPNEGDLGIFVIKTLMNQVELINNPEGKKTIKMVKRK